jgi:hypothetical protein
MPGRPLGQARDDDHPGGAGLGTLGPPPSRLERLCRQAGFSRFHVQDAGDPANLYYEVRP